MQPLITAISSAKRVAVVAHIRPDGDAVGSVVGMCAGLTEIGIEATAVLRDGVPKAFAFLDPLHRVQATLPDDADLYLVLDSPDAARTGFTETIRSLAQTNRLGLIDHHAPGDLTKRTENILHDPSASSTAELVYRVLIALGIRLTADIATALLTGMYTDTGGFQYGNTTNQTLELAAELMRRGGRLNRIVQHVNRQRSVAGLKLLGIALSRLTLTQDKRGAITILTSDDVAHSGGTAEDASGLVNSLNVLPEVSYVMLLTQLEPGMVRGTLRTGEGHSFDVATFARILGGGGHPRASGFVVNGSLEQTQNGWQVVSNLVG